MKNQSQKRNEIIVENCEETVFLTLTEIFSFQMLMQLFPFFQEAHNGGMPSSRLCDDIHGPKGSFFHMQHLGLTVFVIIMVCLHYMLSGTFVASV